MATAISASDRIIIFLREYLAAHTPKKNVIRNCGRYAATVIADTQTPDEVCIVTYHIIANCVNDDPNSVMP
ncbi:MAG: hypothetical protein SOV23_00025 [Eubacteriales bacterium]|nr:hypothetical protein [Eubacteriales bacterium]